MNNGKETQPPPALPVTSRGASSSYTVCEWRASILCYTTSYYSAVTRYYTLRTAGIALLVLPRYWCCLLVVEWWYVATVGVNGALLLPVLLLYLLLFLRLLRLSLMPPPPQLLLLLLLLYSITTSTTTTAAATTTTTFICDSWSPVLPLQHAYTTTYYVT